MPFVLFVASVGFASTPEQQALAEALFRDAKTLMKAGDFAHACPKLEESQRIDPAGGTILNLAYCHEQLGKTATAWAEYHLALTAAREKKRDDRIQVAEEGISRLEPKLSYVVVRVSGDEKTRVTLDAQELTNASWNVRLPVDPGAHVIRAELPGAEPWSLEIQIGTTPAVKEITVPALVVRKDENAKGTTITVGTPTSVYVLAGVGVVLVGATVVARLEVGSAHDDRRALCLSENTLTCDDAGLSAVHRWEAISFVTGGLAAVSFGAAAYVYLSGRSTEPSPSAYVRLAPSLGGLQVQGVF